MDSRMILLVCVFACLVKLVYLVKADEDEVSAMLSSPVERVVGGIPTDIREFPFVVAILREGVQLCGGSLIGPKTVLTAAHCIDIQEISDVSQVSIRAGSNFDDAGGVIAPASRLMLHPKYHPTLFDYDMAIIELAFNVVTRYTHARPVMLWEKRYRFRPGTMGTIIGWGSTKEGEVGPRFIRKARVPIVDNFHCALVYTKQVTERDICAGYAQGGTDSCQGDSGGPLMIDGKLAGVVSFGRGCARPGIPGVYSSVPQFRDWIRQTVNI